MPSLIHVSDDRGMVFIIEPIMRFGIDAIDHDHNKLFTMINKLNNDLLSEVYSDVDIEALYERLLAYATEHFTFEVELLLKMSYDHVVEHTLSHARFMSELASMRERKVKMIEILRFLTSWLNYHVLVEDKHYVEPMKAYLAANPDAIAESQVKQ
jgi:hemerythrin-like metal-binding protein